MSIDRLFRGHKPGWRAGLCFMVAAALAAMALVPIASPARAATNLVQNGSFEEPIVADPALWDIYDAPPAGLGQWWANWMPGVGQYQQEDPPDPAKIELQAGVNGWDPYEGDQYTELDTDWDGPGGPLNGEPASIRLYQAFAASPSSLYTLSFCLSPRPGLDETENAVDVFWGGSTYPHATIARDGSSNSNTVWECFEYTGLPGYDGNLAFSFADVGIPNSLGMFLDDVVVEEMPVPELELEKHSIYNSATGVIHYEIDWSITGEPGSMLYDVSIEDTIPDGTTYVEDSAVPPPVYYFGGVLTWVLGDLTVPDSGTVEFDVYLDAAFASSVVGSDQGLKKNGGPVDGNRSDPNAALGPPESDGSYPDSPWEPEWFFSLGFADGQHDASLTLEFDTPFINGPGPDIFVYEVTGPGGYPMESAKVEASLNGSDWYNLGEVDRDGSVDMDGFLNVGQYIRLTDTSDPGPFPGDADGYDVDAVLALYPAVCGIDNAAEITGWVMDVEQHEGDPKVTAEASTSTGINQYACVPQIDVEKEGAYNEQTGYVDYTITWAVNGHGTLYDVVVSDELPAGVAYVPGSASPLEDDYAGNVLTWELGDITASDGGVITFSVEILSAEEWADFVVSFNQGFRKDGSPVLLERSDENQALGEAEDDDTLNFVSLGFGEMEPTGSGVQLGELILGFNNFIMNGWGDDISVTETSYGSPSDTNYPETVELFASYDAFSWTSLGTGIQDELFDLDPMPWAKYLKLIDRSDKTSPKFPNSADGYDVDGVEALYPAPAECMVENSVMITGHTLNHWWEEYTDEEIADEDTEETMLNPLACDARIYGMKFNDENESGTNDEEEDGLEGWTIYAGHLLQTLEVDSYGEVTGTPIDSYALTNGQKYFIGVSGTFWAGDSITADAKYSVQAPNTEWTDIVQSYEGYGPTLLDLQIDGTSPDWGAYNPGHVYWHTLIGDGSPVTFQIYDIYASNNNGALTVTIYEVIDEDITDENGDYELTIPGGTYPYVQVFEEQQSGWQQTAPGCTGYYTIDLTTETREFFGKDFGNYNSDDNSIFGYKFEDENENGEWDEGELVLEDWKIYIDENDNDEWDEGEPYVLTNNNGYYIFEFLPDGTYVIREVILGGWAQTMPGGKEEYIVEVEDGDEAGEYNFGNFEEPVCGSISGYKFEDLSEDGVWDEGELGLEGWVIFLDEDDDGVWDEGEPYTTTGPNGWYHFDCLEEGTYHVWELIPEGWSQTWPPSMYGGYYELMIDEEGILHWLDINFGNKEGEVETQGNPGGGGGYTPPGDDGGDEEVLGEQEEGSGSEGTSGGGDETVGGEQDTLPVTGLDLMWLAILLMSLSGLILLPSVIRRAENR